MTAIQGRRRKKAKNHFLVKIVLDQGEDQQTVQEDREMVVQIRKNLIQVT